jgi:light-harvesting complex I chlorophyll a/b binding protein 1
LILNLSDFSVSSSDIQADLKYARWAEIKHGRVCMLAIVGMVVQQAGIHIPGEQFANTDVFGAISSVGFAGNLQVLLAIGIVEGTNFSKHYGEGTPGDIGWGNDVLTKLTPEKQAQRQEQEVVHGRLAMIAFTGAIVQTILFNQPLLG